MKEAVARGVTASPSHLVPTVGKHRGDLLLMVRAFINKVPGKRLLGVTAVSLAIAGAAATGLGVTQAQPAEARNEVRCANYWNPTSCKVVWVDYCVISVYDWRC